jgi:hypothetical protein
MPPSALRRSPASEPKRALQEGAGATHEISFRSLSEIMG